MIAWYIVVPIVVSAATFGAMVMAAIAACRDQGELGHRVYDIKPYPPITKDDRGGTT